MRLRSCTLLITCIIFVSLAGCKHDEALEQGRANGGNVGRDFQPPPAKNLAPADIAKLKWIEGTWRGMDGETPFYERYKVEENVLVVETLKEDGSVDGEPERFELKNGEFGKGVGENRSVASSITDNSVQFIPGVPGKRNSFEFERQPDGTWHANLEWPAKDGQPSRHKTYKMEPWQPKK